MKSTGKLLDLLLLLLVVSKVATLACVPEEKNNRSSTQQVQTNEATQANTQESYAPKVEADISNKTINK